MAAYEFDPLGNILQPPGWLRSWMEEMLPRLAPVASILSLQSLVVASSAVQVPKNYYFFIYEKNRHILKYLFKYIYKIT